MMNKYIKTQYFSLFLIAKLQIFIVFCSTLLTYMTNEINNRQNSKTSTKIIVSVVKIDSVQDNNSECLGQPAIYMNATLVRSKERGG